MLHTNPQSARPIVRDQYEFKIFPSYAGSMKRLFDVVLSLLLLPMIVPIVAILYVLVRRDGGAGFFGHARVGKDGKVFKCWKIRSMVPDAQERLEHLLATDPAARAEWERDRKLRNDPRVTRFGNFLRKSSLDELPQIWNVLRGEMSLIGPRPVTASELDRYGAQAWVYEALRPGVTGLRIRRFAPHPSGRCSCAATLSRQQSWLGSNPLRGFSTHNINTKKKGCLVGQPFFFVFGGMASNE